jgi:hypothetical protein
MRLRGITKVLADPNSARSVSARARRRRWDELMGNFPDLAEMSVLDLGGTAAYWNSAPQRPGSLTLLNLFEQAPPWDGVRVLVGDACKTPPQLKEEKFDLVLSNSVIGSVGGHEMRRQFAEVVYGLGDHYWIQTPNRYFPLDPYFLFPFFPMLPVRARVAVSRHWPLGHRQAESPSAAVDHVLTVEYLTGLELHSYFPDGQIWRERFLGMTKSLVAVR